jgi:4-amino-4-deoxy-L-arabinose transferase-like glycosyltransferase
LDITRYLNRPGGPKAVTASVGLHTENRVRPQAVRQTQLGLPSSGQAQVPRSSRARNTLAVLFLILVGAALRIAFLRYPLLDSDQAVVGLMGVHILKGEFPAFFWGQSYTGTLESFVAALLFSLFGVSRLTLNLAPFLFSLLFLLSTWRLAETVFDRRTGLVALALAAIPPMFLTWYSVLARANYIENLVFGNLLFLIAIRLVGSGLRPSDHLRTLGIYGFVAGFAFYMNFQSIHYLVTSAIFLLWRGQLRVLLRQSWVCVAGFLLGSIPLWIHNLSTGFSSLAAIKAASQRSSIQESIWTLLHSTVPTILGIADFPYNYEPVVTRQLAFLWGPILALYLSSLVLAVRLLTKTRAQRSHLGIEMLVLLPIVVLAITTAEGFTAGSDARYLLPLYTSTTILMAALVTALARFSRLLGGLVIAVLLASNLYGHATTLEGLPRSDSYVADDHALFTAMREHGLKYAFVPDYWLSYRLTFDAGESLIFATPPLFHSNDVRRRPEYTRLVSQSPRSAYVVWGGDTEFEQTLAAAGEHPQKLVIGRFSLFYDFKPAPDRRDQSLPAATWRPVGSSGREAFDRDFGTTWQGEPGEPMVVDLGKLSSLVGISLYLGESFRVRHGFEVMGSEDGTRWNRIAVTGPPFPGLMRVGDRLIFEACRERLGPGGVLVMNVAAALDASRLLGALDTTLEDVFGNVRFFQLPAAGPFANTLLFASDAPLEVPPPERIPLALRSLGLGLRTMDVPPEHRRVLTDDDAPIEWLTDLALLEALR